MLQRTRARVCYMNPITCLMETTAVHPISVELVLLKHSPLILFILYFNENNFYELIVQNNFILSANRNLRNY